MAQNSPVKRRWLRWIVYAALSVVVLFVLFVVFGLYLDSGAITTKLHQAVTDPAYAAKAGITEKIVESGANVRPAPPGWRGHFLWQARPSGANVQIDTFDNADHTAAAFELFRHDNSGSLLIADLDEDTGPVKTTVFSNFTKGRVDSSIEKLYLCAERHHSFSCGSIIAGLPAIVTIRLAIEADWKAVSDEEKNDIAKSMARLSRSFKKTDTVAAETQSVIATLKRLGVRGADPDKGK